MARTSLPPGFRFHPTDVELIMYYLKRKVLGKKLHFEAIADVNIYKFSPWDLPDKSCLKSKDREWFFFCPRERKYASGIRVKRATENGYWKTTGKDRPISYKDKTVGTVKTLVFHLGHAPKGERTDWVIHEYKILDQLVAAGVQDTYVLCKVFKKNGPGPKNGAQYGAPFEEEEWTDDDIDDAENQAISLASDVPSPTTLTLPETQSSPPVIGSVLPLADNGPSPSAGHSTIEVLVDDTEDELGRILASFMDEDTLPCDENGSNQGHLSVNGKGKSILCSDGNDVYNGLADLDSWGGRIDFSGMQKDDYSLNNMLMEDTSAYIELNDLLTPLRYPEVIHGANQPTHGNVYGSFGEQNMQQFYPGSTSAGIMQSASCTNQLPGLPGGSYINGYSLDLIQMGSSGAYDLDFPNGHQENGVNFTQNMERGKHKKISISRSARPPSAAAEQIALSFCCCSSIHIKAEVTHRICTKDALSVMMGGSGSCWCNLPCAVFEEIWLRLLYLVEFSLCVILVSCCLSETLSYSWSYIYDYPTEYSLVIVMDYSNSNFLYSLMAFIKFCDIHNNVNRWSLGGDYGCLALCLVFVLSLFDRLVFICCFNNLLCFYVIGFGLHLILIVSMQVSLSVCLEDFLLSLWN